MSGSIRGVVIDLEPIWLQTKAPGEQRGFPFDIANLIGSDDKIVSLSAASAPSGAGELQLAAISLSGTAITISNAGGQPTREYTIVVTATMSDGEVFNFIVRQKVSAIFATDQAPAPPSWAFGTPVTWSAGVSFALSGIALTLVNTTGYPTSASGLAAGAVWANGDFVSAVPGGTGSPAPLYYGQVTAAQLLAQGMAGQPTTDPHVANQLWLNGVMVCVSTGV